MQQHEHTNCMAISQNADEDEYVLPDDDDEFSQDLSEQGQIDQKNISKKQEMRDITENTEDEVIDDNLFVQSNGKLSYNGDRV